MSEFTVQIGMVNLEWWNGLEFYGVDWKVPVLPGVRTWKRVMKGQTGHLTPTGQLPNIDMANSVLILIMV